MLISIIIPFFKGNKYINTLLVSIERNYAECHRKAIQLECIIVNDSPGYDIAIDNRMYSFGIKIICNERNLGIHASRIRGIKSSMGDYIIMIDQDDILLSNAIVTLFHEIKLADVCVGNGYVQRNGKPQVIFRNRRVQKISSNIDVICKLYTLIVSPGQCLIKKTAIPKVWLENVMEINGSDDEMLWLLMKCSNRKFSYTREKVYMHIDTGENVSRDNVQLIRSSTSGIKNFQLYRTLSKRNLNYFVRRRKMKKEQFESGGLKRVINYLKNIDLTLYAIYIHIIL